jgi:hypothetical protein
MRRDFLEKCNAENLQDFAQTAIEFQLPLEYGHEHVNTFFLDFPSGH